MISRYSRQELFAGIGQEGQAKIRTASIAIVGCGALGSLQAETLARAGTGKITIIDRDFVEMVNLQRQSLFTEQDAEHTTPKAIAAAERLRAINREVEVVAVVADLSADNLSLLNHVDVILDGTDNFQTRYLLNDFAWKNQVPWIYGACVGSSGIASAFIPDSFPCLRCLFESEPPAGSVQTCDTAGIIWPAVASVVSYQVAAAFKILSGVSQKPQILQLDVWENHFHTISLEKAKRSECETCGLRSFPALNSRADWETSLCGRDAIQIKPSKKVALDLDEMVRKWRPVGTVYRNPFLVKLTLPENEIVLFSDGRAMIKGTHDFARARDLYAKYVGS